ncbi:twin-arginine translocation signal domain-containing protein [Mesorhizobium retamae]|uniref:Twin-arginine translocation signal domain-containing protein n=1 Tax=Mesorhizobium retamae TaxID=2912854 RepID=A0ABS9QNW5_9HYPH|nr:twin-arginine translocation signal domain-containing protein [Mesorhizobium sp. IRAMC:0171]MCG7508528.1 twin-arginine translocation signal domain-containing protein [Mesorhizobium sp. IRAMC:0171]
MTRPSKSITRRLFLRNSAVVGVATVTTPSVAAEPAQSARDRLELAIAALKAAADELWPNADDWMVKIEATPAIPLLISNYDPLAKGQRNV